MIEIKMLPKSFLSLEITLVTVSLNHGLEKGKMDNQQLQDAPTKVYVNGVCFHQTKCGCSVLKGQLFKT